MPRKGQRKCAGCGEWIQTDWEAPDYGDGDYHYSRAGKLFCDGCHQSGHEHASTVVTILPQTEAGDVDNETLYSEVVTTRFDEDFIYFVECDGDYADFEDEDPYPEPVAGQHWVSTDAWRGYVAFDWLEGFEEVVKGGGWVTGYSDETTRRKADIGELFEDIKSGELVPPVALYWVFGTTSNVFSTACDIVVKSADREQLEAWLEQCAGTSVEDLRYQLG